MLICKYGCGQEAKYKLKNGNDCYSKWSTQCPEIHEKEDCSYHDLKCEGGD